MYTDRDNDTIFISDYHSYRDAIERCDRWERNERKAILRIQVATDPGWTSGSRCAYLVNSQCLKSRYPEQEDASVYEMVTDDDPLVNSTTYRSAGQHLSTENLMIYPEPASDVEMRSAAGSVSHSVTNTTSSDDSCQQSVVDVQSYYSGFRYDDMEDSRWTYGGASSTPRPDEIESICIIENPAHLL